jgi:hypothetical protein
MKCLRHCCIVLEKKKKECSENIILYSISEGKALSRFTFGMVSVKNIFRTIEMGPYVYKGKLSTTCTVSLGLLG